MLSVKLPYLIGYALIISAILLWLNYHGAGIAAAALWSLAVCVAIAVLSFLGTRPGARSLRALEPWLIFCLLPTVAVFAVSRASLLKRRPWLLLVLGPLCYVIATFIVSVSYNLVVPSNLNLFR